MKKLIISIIVVTILASCEKTLQEVPRDFISRTNYYKNQSDAEGAINGVYSAFASDYGITFWLFQVLHSDYALGRGSQAPISIFNSILDQTNINRAATIWSSFYTTINRANSVLDNVPGIEGINEEVKQRILSEAHFFRALSYFNLVRGFGPVPIKIHES
ncbi:MAG: RagB/SusD family nutrient uptake outer membrane protein, partial [Saprospiraceae bacterium]|nr:RagB/SusD family nutrient uptake outer membrane protein [Saprospiraceae bacterium]